MRLADKNLTIDELKSLVELLQQMQAYVVEYEEGNIRTPYLCPFVNRSAYSYTIKSIVYKELNKVLGDYISLTIIANESFIRRYGEACHAKMDRRNSFFYDSLGNSLRKSLLNLWLSQATRYLKRRERKEGLL